MEKKETGSNMNVEESEKVREGTNIITLKDDPGIPKLVILPSHLITRNSKGEPSSVTYTFHKGRPVIVDDDEDRESFLAMTNSTGESLFVEGPLVKDGSISADLAVETLFEMLAETGVDVDGLMRKIAERNAKPAGMTTEALKPSGVKGGKKESGDDTL